MPEPRSEDGPLIAAIVDALPMGTPYSDGSTPEEVARRILDALGLVEVEGADTCVTHTDGVLLETGSGVCDMSEDNEECVGAPLYRRAHIGRSGDQ